jgi:C_GCAxxG_C_C family probable redox protein
LKPEADASGFLFCVMYVSYQKNITMKKSQLAIENFKSMNCAQSVLLSHAEDLKLDRTTAIRVALGFGAGMAMGETCGAVTGAYMVLGLKARFEGKTPLEIKTESKASVRRFNELFIAKNGSLQCKKLIGVDLFTPEGQTEAREKGLFALVCNKLVASSAEILENEF